MVQSFTSPERFAKLRANPKKKVTRHIVFENQFILPMYKKEYHRPIIDLDRDKRFLDQTHGSLVPGVVYKLTAECHIWRFNLTMDVLFDTDEVFEPHMAIEFEVNRHYYSGLINDKDLNFDNVDNFKEDEFRNLVVWFVPDCYRSDEALILQIAA